MLQGEADPASWTHYCPVPASLRFPAHGAVPGQTPSQSDAKSVGHRSCDYPTALGQGRGERGCQGLWLNVPCPHLVWLAWAGVLLSHCTWPLTAGSLLLIKVQLLVINSYGSVWLGLGEIRTSWIITQLPLPKADSGEGEEGPVRN